MQRNILQSFYFLKFMTCLLSNFLFSFFNTFLLLITYFKYLANVLHFPVFEKETQNVKIPNQRKREEEFLVLVQRDVLNAF